MSVSITLRADGTLEGLEEARAHILASPVRRAQVGALLQACSNAVREAAPEKGMTSRVSTKSVAPKTPNKTPIFPAAPVAA